MRRSWRWAPFAAAVVGAAACTQILGMEEPCLPCPGAASHCFDDSVCVSVDSVCEESQEPFEKFRECACRDEKQHCLGPCARWCDGEEVTDRGCADCLRSPDLCPEERGYCLGP
jgi:hypothetical protein